MNAPKKQYDIMDVIDNKDEIIEACHISTDCTDNIITGLRQVFLEMGEVKLAVGKRILAQISDFTEDQIDSVLKRRDLNKPRWEKWLKMDMSVGLVNTCNLGNTVADPIDEIDDFDEFYKNCSNPEKRVVAILLHNPDMNQRKLVSIYGGDSLAWKKGWNELPKCFGVKRVKYIPDDIMNSDLMQTWLADHPCPPPKQSKEAWNGLTDKALIKRLQEIYGRNKKLPGLATEKYKENGRPYAPPRFKLNTNEDGLALIRDYYLSLRKHYTKGWPYDPVLLSRPHGHLWNNKTDFLGQVIKHGINREFAKTPKDTKQNDHMQTVRLDSFMQMYEDGHHHNDSTIRRFVNDGIKPPVLIDEDLNLWRFSHPRNLREFAGINDPDYSFDNRYLDAKQMKKIGPKGDWLSRLYMWAKLLAGFASPDTDANDGIGIWEMQEGFILYAPPIVKSQARHMINIYKRWSNQT